MTFKFCILRQMPLRSQSWSTHSWTAPWIELTACACMNMNPPKSQATVIPSSTLKRKNKNHCSSCCTTLLRTRGDLSQGWDTLQYPWRSHSGSPTCYVSSGKSEGTNWQLSTQQPTFSSTISTTIHQSNCKSICQGSKLLSTFSFWAILS